MSIAAVSFDLHPFDIILPHDAQAGNARDQHLPPTNPGTPPARPGGISQKQLGMLIVQHICGLERVAARLAPQRADAQDLVQETCRRALIAHATFAPGTNVAAWLRCILRNLHRDWIRRGRHEIPIAGPCETWAAAVPEDRPSWTHVSDEDVAQALARLPPLYRAVYVLRATEGRSYQEIARTLRVPTGTVATRLSRARGMLRKLLMDDQPGTARQDPAAG